MKLTELILTLRNNRNSLTTGIDTLFFSFCKASNSKYFTLCTRYCLCHNSSAPQWQGTEPTGNIQRNGWQGTASTGNIQRNGCDQPGFYFTSYQKQYFIKRKRKQQTEQAQRMNQINIFIQMHLFLIRQDMLTSTKIVNSYCATTRQ